MLLQLEGKAVFPSDRWGWLTKTSFSWAVPLHSAPFLSHSMIFFLNCFFTHYMFKEIKMIPSTLIVSVFMFCFVHWEPDVYQALCVSYVNDRADTRAPWDEGLAPPSLPCHARAEVPTEVSLAPESHPLSNGGSLPKTVREDVAFDYILEQLCAYKLPSQLYWQVVKREAWLGGSVRACLTHTHMHTHTLTHKDPQRLCLTSYLATCHIQHWATC